MKLTEEEKRKLRYNISVIERTKPSYVYVEEQAEEVSEKEKHVYATVKWYRVGVLVWDGSIVKTWHVV